MKQRKKETGCVHFIVGVGWEGVNNSVSPQTIFGNCQVMKSHGKIINGPQNLASQPALRKVNGVYNYKSQ